MSRPAQIQITVLEAGADRTQTKVFRPSGTTPSHRAKWFTPHTVTVSSFEDLTRLLTSLADQTDRMMVLGTVAERYRDAVRIRRISYDKADYPASLVDNGSRLIVFDVDDMPVPKGFGWHDPAALAAEVWSRICEELPALGHAFVHWQA